MSGVETTINDAELNIDWRLPLEKLQLSAKDEMHPNLVGATELFS